MPFFSFEAGPWPWQWFDAAQTQYQARLEAQYTGERHSLLVSSQGSNQALEGFDEKGGRDHDQGGWGRSAKSGLANVVLYTPMFWAGASVFTAFIGFLAWFMKSFPSNGMAVLSALVQNNADWVVSYGSSNALADIQQAGESKANFDAIEETLLPVAVVLLVTTFMQMLSLLLTAGERKKLIRAKVGEVNSGEERKEIIAQVVKHERPFKQDLISILIATLVVVHAVFGLVIYEKLGNPDRFPASDIPTEDTWPDLYKGAIVDGKQHQMAYNTVTDLLSNYYKYLVTVFASAGGLVAAKLFYDGKQRRELEAKHGNQFGGRAVAGGLGEPQLQMTIQTVQGLLAKQLGNAAWVPARERDEPKGDYLNRLLGQVQAPAKPLRARGGGVASAVNDAPAVDDASDRLDQEQEEKMMALGDLQVQAPAKPQRPPGGGVASAVDDALSEFDQEQEGTESEHQQQMAQLQQQLQQSQQKNAELQEQLQQKTAAQAGLVERAQNAEAARAAAPAAEELAAAQARVEQLTREKQALERQMQSNMDVYRRELQSEMQKALEMQHQLEQQGGHRGVFNGILDEIFAHLGSVPLGRERNLPANWVDKLKQKDGGAAKKYVEDFSSLLEDIDAKDREEGLGETEKELRKEILSKIEELKQAAPGREGAAAGEAKKSELGLQARKFVRESIKGLKNKTAHKGGVEVDPSVRVRAIMLTAYQLSTIKNVANENVGMRNNVIIALDIATQILAALVAKLEQVTKDKTLQVNWFKIIEAVARAMAEMKENPDQKALAQQEFARKFLTLFRPSLMESFDGNFQAVLDEHQAEVEQIMASLK